ncbi:MAG: excinuclease ABC subunit UvrA [Deltaproteobacteria bacterium]|nr:MAG: excinuclease ABC subunit UvrA [Deltaproteobacteria bacterium]
MGADVIRIRGARQHNLKNISLDIPRNKLVVITGLSGSGKSSLAFDTIYAEGQRRYVESLSAYARQFLEQMDKPDVDSIEGLSPAISIGQRSSGQNPRSTVGTVTEVYDYMRVLYARIGIPHCPDCHIPIRSSTVQEMVDRILELEKGSKVQVLAPLVRGGKGEFGELFGRLRRDGFTRVKVDGQERLLDEEIRLNKNKTHDIEVVVDRVVIKDEIRPRLTDSVELALALSEGLLLVEVLGGEQMLLSQKAVCPRCGYTAPEVNPQMFSFNNPQGACPQCSGLGTKKYFDPDLIVPDPSLSLREGAVLPWSGRDSVYFYQMLDSLCSHYGVDIYTPFRDLPENFKKVLFYGSGKEKIRFYFEKDDRRYHYSRPFEGIIPALDRRYREADSYQAREELEQYMNIIECTACGGARLRAEALAVKVGGKGIHEVSSLPIEKAWDFFERLSLGRKEREIAERLLREIGDRLRFLISVGVEYLTLDRATSTLSGGEEQRIRLATQLSSSLAGVLYVLDEPTIGLHQRDNQRLIKNLVQLKEMGNSVIVVEHDPETILSADHVIDMGPGAGAEGGKVIFQGTPRELMAHSDSETGLYLSGEKKIPVPARRRKGNGLTITIEGAAENNLKDIRVEIPLGTLTCITGVSGSGKSSLINGILYPALCRRLYRSKVRIGKVRKIQGIEYVDKVINIDQSPIGRTPRSNPATYTGVFSHIRELFSRVPDARARGYKPGRFSFNVRGGRCEVCKGEGVIKIEMHFLPDVYVTCEACKGLRYNRDTLDIRYKGYNIAEVLDMTVSQAMGFFERIPRVYNILRTVADVGLGYIKLGQPATTLSGGEAQRMKLSRELSKRSTGRTIYLLDEPTTGLHFADVHKLLEVLGYLVDMNNTVLIIEHNLEVIKCADYVIDLGPEGGDKGGELVASGTPEQICAAANSYTGQFLQKVLQ